MERRNTLQTRSSGLASTSTAYEETMAFPARIKPHDKCDSIFEDAGFWRCLFCLALVRRPIRALLSQIFPTGILVRLVSRNLLQSARHHCGAARQVRPQGLGGPGDTSVRSILRLGNGLVTKEPSMVCSGARSDKTVLSLVAQRRRTRTIERKAWEGEAPFMQDLLDWHPRPLRTRRQ